MIADPFAGTNWELPPRAAPRTRLRFVLALLAVATLTTCARGAEVWLFWKNEPSYGAVVRLTYTGPNGYELFPAEWSLTETAAGSGVYRGVIPPGRYLLEVGTVIASGGEWHGASVEVAPDTVVVVSRWLPGEATVAYGAGLAAVGTPGGEPVVPPSGSTGSTVGADDWSGVWAAVVVAWFCIWCARAGARDGAAE